MTTKKQLFTVHIPFFPHISLGLAGHGLYGAPPVPQLRKMIQTFIIFILIRIIIKNKESF